MIGKVHSYAARDAFQYRKCPLFCRALERSGPLAWPRLAGNCRIPRRGAVPGLGSTLWAKKLLYRHFVYRTNEESIWCEKKDENQLSSSSSSPPFSGPDCTLDWVRIMPSQLVRYFRFLSLLRAEEENINKCFRICKLEHRTFIMISRPHDDDDVYSIEF